MQTIEQALNKLETSKFRSSFALSEADIKYIDKNGIDKIKLHAKDFVKARLSSAYPANDGKQTPMRGHPVFIAQARDRLLLPKMPLQVVQGSHRSWIDTSSARKDS